MTDGAERAVGMWESIKFLHLDLSWHLVVRVSWPSIWPPPQECLQHKHSTCSQHPAHLILDIIDTGLSLYSYVRCTETYR